MLKVKGDKPKYLQLVEHLRSQIDEGALKPGDKLPSYGMLNKRYGLTQSTVDRSHKLLERDGYVERMERKGIFVTPLERRKNETAGGLMNRSVLVLTSGTSQVWDGHKQTGWSEYLTLGAINEVRRQSRNVMSLEPANFKSGDIEYWIKHPPAGAVIIGEPSTSPLMMETAHRLQDIGVPVVIYGDEPEWQTFDRVISDHEQGNYELTRWLLERGCRHILPMRAERIDSYWLSMRDGGYERALAEAGVEPLPPCVRPPYDSPEDKRELFDAAVKASAKNLDASLKRCGSVDAIMTITDGEVSVMAAACRTLDLEPNRDVLLVGYDHYWEDVLERQFEKTTPLATVDKRNVEIGAQLVQLLEERIADRLDDAPQCRKIAPKLLTF